MQNNTEENKSVTALNRALFLFSKNKPVIPFNSKVEFKTGNGQLVEFEYADLGGIDKAIKPELIKQKLRVFWEFSNEDEKLQAVVMHQDGAKEVSGFVKYGNGSPDMKTTGGNITYVKRYTLSALLDLNTEEDKDMGYLENSNNNLMGLMKQKVQTAELEELQTQEKTLIGQIKKAEAGEKYELGLSLTQLQELLTLVKEKLNIE